MKKQLNLSAKHYEQKKSNYSFYKESISKDFCRPRLEYILELRIFLTGQKICDSIRSEYRFELRLFRTLADCENNSFFQQFQKFL